MTNRGMVYSEQFHDDDDDDDDDDFRDLDILFSTIYFLRSHGVKINLTRFCMLMRGCSSMVTSARALGQESCRHADDFQPMLGPRLGRLNGTSFIESRSLMNHSECPPQHGVTQGHAPGACSSRSATGSSSRKDSQAVALSYLSAHHSSRSLALHGRFKGSSALAADVRAQQFQNALKSVLILTSEGGLAAIQAVVTDMLLLIWFTISECSDPVTGRHRYATSEEKLSYCEGREVKSTVLPASWNLVLNNRQQDEAKSSLAVQSSRWGHQRTQILAEAAQKINQFGCD
ncbi:uncharacterized protein MYCFIDRAFT_207810 [Pseudocercospora fijiensis CIRAD86]|uniref:Uncharacterized protein n=1 Tax=Pseudocercospora fijiensis (strain CIRAD86) TaxID=383855 RepID=M3B244_PSEFD|nr:uncharacterized protein MYCFIDRAFT_207810 [Pseudocercospora fijiensis CIRAD86]EME83482.1 hypothetical protein MYCFIDRAFT_207810 [Pseudocercospora fijiensis CIRAD86]